ncbi:MAG TPA: hypothetical protein VE869_16300, partial [Gemmatimonas sp.]|nr:hypothetical protein [Gemmatimonas sp.]
PHVLCGVTGGSARAELRTEIARGHGDEAALIVDVSPAFILQAGLPYAASDIAVVMDADLTDVPERYQDTERAARIVSVIADALPRKGLLVAPAKLWDVQDYARDQGCTVAVFSGENDVTQRDRFRARSAAWVEDGHVVVEHRGRVVSRERLKDDVAPAVQAAAALAVRALQPPAGQITG